MGNLSPAPGTCTVCPCALCVGMWMDRVVPLLSSQVADGTFVSLRHILAPQGTRGQLTFPCLDTPPPL